MIWYLLFSALVSLVSALTNTLTFLLVLIPTTGISFIAEGIGYLKTLSSLFPPISTALYITITYILYLAFRNVLLKLVLGSRAPSKS